MTAPKPAKKRLDELMMDRGLSPSRAAAKGLILAGKVRSGTAILDKPGKSYPEDIDLTVIQPPRFVGRGGEKLESFLEAFPVAIEGRWILDVGASTGGFTDCLLQRGATGAVCVDVGRGQLHHKLVQDPRVTNIERLNARNLTPSDLPRADFGVIVMDLSFISLTKVLPAVWPFLEPDGTLVCLVKPQFEAEKKEVDRGSGVIRDPEIRRAVLEKIRQFAAETLTGSEEIGWVESTIAGADGNREYLLGLRRRTE